MKTTTKTVHWNVSKLASPSYAPQFGIYADEEPNDLAIVKGDNSEANAELICRAVNSHAELLEACKFVLSQLDPLGDHPKTQCVLNSDCLSPKDTDDQSVVEYLKAAIAKAEAQ